MVANLKEHCGHLSRLLEAVPAENSYKSISELNEVFDKYLKILNFVNGYNEIYKSATTIYYSDITNIRDNMHEFLLADSQAERERAFEKAKNELRSDLSALSMLLQPQQEITS